MSVSGVFWQPCSVRTMWDGFGSFCAALCLCFQEIIFCLCCVVILCIF